MLLDEKKAVLQIIPRLHLYLYTRDSDGRSEPGEFTIPAATGAARIYMVLFTTDEDMQRSTKLSAEVLQRAMEYDRASDVSSFPPLGSAPPPRAASI